MNLLWTYPSRQAKLKEWDKIHDYEGKGTQKYIDLG